MVQAHLVLLQSKRKNSLFWLLPSPLVGRAVSIWWCDFEEWGMNCQPLLTLERKRGMIQQSLLTLERKRGMIHQPLPTLERKRGMMRQPLPTLEQKWGMIHQSFPIPHLNNDKRTAHPFSQVCGSYF